MRFLVPFLKSRIVRSSSARLLPKGRKNSMLCAALGFAAWLVQELLYRDVLWEALGLVQKPKALKIFTAVYHSSHSLNERKGIIFPPHIQDVKIDSLRLTDY